MIVTGSFAVTIFSHCLGETWRSSRSLARLMLCVRPSVTHTVVLRRGRKLIPPSASPLPSPSTCHSCHLPVHPPTICVYSSATLLRTTASPTPRLASLPPVPSTPRPSRAAAHGSSKPRADGVAPHRLEATLLRGSVPFCVSSFAAHRRSARQPNSGPPQAPSLDTPCP